MNSNIVGERKIIPKMDVHVTCSGEMAEYFSGYFTEEFLDDYLFIKLCELYDHMKGKEMFF